MIYHIKFKYYITFEDGGHTYYDNLIFAETDKYNKKTLVLPCQHYILHYFKHFMKHNMPEVKLITSKISDKLDIYMNIHSEPELPNVCYHRPNDLHLINFEEFYKNTIKFIYLNLNLYSMSIGIKK